MKHPILHAISENVSILSYHFHAQSGQTRGEKSSRPKTSPTITNLAYLLCVSHRQTATIDSEILYEKRKLTNDQ